MARRAALARALAARGVPPPATIEWHATIVSTNDRLKALARQGAPEWTLVGADRQTGGRGREGRAWISPPGGLYLSVLLRPRFAQIGLLPLAAGLAVAEVAAQHGLEVQLKWPNDVLVRGAAPAQAMATREPDERKLAGILAEASSGSAGTDWVVLGIGVNLAVADGSLPPELARRVATLSEAGSGPPPDVVEVAASVVAQLGLWYDALGSSPASVVGAWRARAVAWWGERIAIRTGRERVRGRLVDVDEEGALLVEVDGERRRFLSGEVERVRREGE